MLLCSKWNKKNPTPVHIKVTQKKLVCSLLLSIFKQFTHRQD